MFKQFKGLGFLGLVSWLLLSSFLNLAQAEPVTTTYKYNALGERVMKAGPAVPGGVIYFVYDEEGHLLGEYGPGGSMIQEIVWLEDLPVASLRPSSSGSGIDIFNISSDHLGTPRVIRRATDNVMVWRWDSDPFGNGAPNENPSGVGVFKFNLRFPGQYFDEETGLHYNYSRDYDPRTGRYVQSDPIGLEGGINPFAYTQNNPLARIDPRGLADIAFNRSSGTITVNDRDGKIVGSFPAANNVTSSSKGLWPDGTYDYSHHVGHPESSPTGPYGSNGNFVFKVPNRVGMGLHSGRKSPESKTLGCIRTTDEATEFLRVLSETDPLKTITVR